MMHYLQMNAVNKHNYTAMMIAAKNGSEDILRLLLDDNRYCVQQPEKWNDSPLQIATQNGMKLFYVDDTNTGFRFT